MVRQASARPQLTPPSRSLSLARPPAAGVDLETVSDRMAIRNAIQCGDVQQAIERVNALDSTILEGNAELSFKLKLRSKPPSIAPPSLGPCSSLS